MHKYHRAGTFGSSHWRSRGRCCSKNRSLHSTGVVTTREAYDIGRQSDSACWARTVDTVKLLVVVGVKASDTACLACAACMCVTCAGSTWVLLGGVLCRNAPGQITPWRLGQAWQHKYGKARNTPEQKPVPYRSHISHCGVAQSWSSWQHCPPANVTALVVVFSCQTSQGDMKNHAHNVESKITYRRCKLW